MQCSALECFCDRAYGVLAYESQVCNTAREATVRLES